MCRRIGVFPVRGTSPKSDRTIGGFVESDVGSGGLGWTVGLAEYTELESGDPTLNRAARTLSCTAANRPCARLSRPDPDRSSMTMRGIKIAACYLVADSNARMAKSRRKPMGVTRNVVMTVPYMCSAMTRVPTIALFCTSTVKSLPTSRKRRVCVVHRVDAGKTLEAMAVFKPCRQAARPAFRDRTTESPARRPQSRMSGVKSMYVLQSWA